MDVTFVIINYNTAALTTACIQSIYQYTKEIDFEIILVDNASPERSVASITTFYPEIQFFQSKGNIGFGRANNLAIDQSKGKYLFLLNSDTLLISDAAQTFFHYMEDASNLSVACCGGALIHQDGKAQVSYGNFPTIFEAFSSLGPLLLYPTFFKRHVSSGVFNYSPEVRSVDYICGADMFIRKSVLDQIGTFDPEFFLYFEEVDLSLRMQIAGFKSVLLPQVKIIHLEGGSQADSSHHNPVKALEFAKSRQLYFKKHHSSFKTKIVNKIYGIQALLFSVTKREKSYLKVAKILFKL
jgi:GT2 family glycosyltransferase